MTTHFEQRWHQNLFICVVCIICCIWVSANWNCKNRPGIHEHTRSILKYYVAIFLIIRFNPFTNPEHKTQRGKFDGQIAYTAGVFLLLTSAVMGVMKNYVGKIGNAVGVHLNTSAITM